MIVSGPGVCSAALASAWRMLVHVVPSQMPVLSAVPVTRYVSALAAGAIASVAAAVARNVLVHRMTTRLLAERA